MRANIDKRRDADLQQLQAQVAQLHDQLAALHQATSQSMVRVNPISQILFALNTRFYTDTQMCSSQLSSAPAADTVFADIISFILKWVHLHSVHRLMWQLRHQLQCPNPEKLLALNISRRRSDVNWYSFLILKIPTLADAKASDRKPFGQRRHTSKAFQIHNSGSKAAEFSSILHCNWAISIFSFLFTVIWAWRRLVIAVTSSLCIS